MGILDRLQKVVAAPMEVAEVNGKPASQATDAGVDKIQATQTRQTPQHLMTLLQGPHVSEKAAHLGVHNTYVFKVACGAEKIAIKRAVESLYPVHVQAVRTVRMRGKPVRRGRRLSARSNWKKAFVTVAPGEKLDVYEGV